MGNLAKLMGYLPAIIETIATGTDLLHAWNVIREKGDAITDAELVRFASDMEAALAESQAALRP